MNDTELMHKIDEILYGEHEQPYSTGDALLMLIRNQIQANITANYTPNSEVAEREREWWITDALHNGEHVTVLGPFTTDKDAGIAREYMECAPKNDNKNFWIERLANPKEKLQ